MMVGVADMQAFTASTLGVLTADRLKRGRLAILAREIKERKWQNSGKPAFCPFLLISR
jgi:hypothetical protein